MRKNRMMRLASTLLVLTLMTTCAISGTFAKYTTTASASDAARVAKWEIEVNDNELTTDSPTITFDLFNTIYDTKDDAAETDVVKDLIAPGTKGSFALKVENLSEVNATYTIVLSETQANVPTGISRIPIEYSLDGSTWKTDFTDINNDATMKDKALTMGSGINTVTVYWRWVYSTSEASDAIDTAIGIAAQTATEADDPAIKVTATITVTQVD